MPPLASESSDSGSSSMPLLTDASSDEEIPTAPKPKSKPKPKPRQPPSKTGGGEPARRGLLLPVKRGALEKNILSTWPKLTYSRKAEVLHVRGPRLIGTCRVVLAFSLKTLASAAVAS